MEAARPVMESSLAATAAVVESALAAPAAVVESAIAVVESTDAYDSGWF